MAILTVTPLSSTANESEDGTIGYVTEWRVVTDSRTDGARAVLSASGLPRRGDAYLHSGDSDSFASCRSRSAKLESFDKTAKVWIVTCNFSTQGNSSNPSNNNNSPTDPINWDWSCRLSSWSRQEAPDKDRNDRPFNNVCGEPFLPPPEKTNDDPLVILTKNNPTTPLLGWAEAIGKVNSSSMWGLDVRRVKLKKWDVDEHWMGPGMMYFTWHIECEIKFDGYYFRPPNMGFKEKFGVNDDGTPKLTEITDTNGIPTARPLPLNSEGRRLPDGAPVEFFDQAAGVLQRFEIEDEFDISQYLPPSLPGAFT